MDAQTIIPPMTRRPNRTHDQLAPLGVSTKVDSGPKRRCGGDVAASVVLQALGPVVVVQDLAPVVVVEQLPGLEYVAEPFVTLHLSVPPRLDLPLQRPQLQLDPVGDPHERLIPNPPIDGARTAEGGKGVTSAMMRA